MHPDDIPMIRYSIRAYEISQTLVRSLMILSFLASLALNLALDPVKNLGCTGITGWGIRLLPLYCIWGYFFLKKSFQDRIDKLKTIRIKCPDCERCYPMDYFDRGKCDFCVISDMSSSSASSTPCDDEY